MPDLHGTLIVWDGSLSHWRPSIRHRSTSRAVAGAPQEKIQRGLGHSKSETTRIYLREDIEINRELARLRAEKRKP
jgi:hypothetical protein